MMKHAKEGRYRWSRKWTTKPPTPDHDRKWTFAARFDDERVWFGQSGNITERIGVLENETKRDVIAWRVLNPHFAYDSENALKTLRNAMRRYRLHGQWFERAAWDALPDHKLRLREIIPPTDEDRAEIESEMDPRSDAFAEKLVAMRRAEEERKMQRLMADLTEKVLADLRC